MIDGNPSVTGGPGAGFVGAWGFGRYVREASAGRGRDSEKALTLRGGRREALAPAPSTKKSAPHDSKRTARTPGQGTFLPLPRTSIHSVWPPVTEGLLIDEDFFFE